MVKTPRTETVVTTWEIRTYDVWGNARDGYEVNDSFNQGEITLRIPITTHNVGTPHEFRSASPTNKQIRQAFGVRCQLDTDGPGDDINIYVNRERDGYPIGEMHCTSHESLSPPRPVKAD